MLKTFLLTRNHIYYTMVQPKFHAAMLMILTANYINVQSVSQIVFRYDTPISFGIFALIFSGSFFSTVLSIALLFIFSELPFKNAQQVFLITRSGKRTWCVSWILYIAAVSVFVLLSVLIETFLIFGGKISFDNSSWGKVIMSVYNTNLGSEYEVTFRAGAPYESIIAVSPSNALLYVIVTEFFLSVAMGLVVFSVNLVTHGVGGIIIGGVPIALNLFLSYFDNITFFRLSPFSWVKLSGVIKLPFTWYPVLILSIISFAAILGALGRCRKSADIL